jgi:hypothetical protein
MKFMFSTVYRVTQKCTDVHKNIFEFLCTRKHKFHKAFSYWNINKTFLYISIPDTLYMCMYSLFAIVLLYFI